MISSKTTSILIVDPQQTLAKPYDFLPAATVTHVTSIPQAAQYLHDQTPDLVVASASFSPNQMIQLMEALKEAASHRSFLIPLVLMVDLENRINFVPGTHWGQKFGILCSISSQDEVNAVLKRVCAEQKTFGY